MRPRSPLTPHGLLHAAHAGGTAVAGPPFPRGLLPVLESLGVGEEVLLTAWELTRLAGALTDDEHALLLAVLLATFVAARRGSTRLPLDDDSVVALLGQLGASDGHAAAKLLRDPRLAALLGAPGDYRPLILDGNIVYHQRLHYLEERLVAQLKARLAAAKASAVPVPSTADIDRVLADLARRPARKGGTDLVLSAEQGDAVRLALTAPLAVVTGGPGTGKTSILVSILRALARLGVGPERVALAAPTGKAAHRMGEAIGAALRSIADPSTEDAALATAAPTARTLHRLLGYSPGGDRFRHHANNPLSEAVVLVDESSMLDLALTDQLLRAVATGARLVLFGDAEQLPSVEAGAVFRDLCPAAGGPVPSVRLTRSYRMDPADPAGRNVLAVANQMTARDPAALFTGAAETITRRATPPELAFAKVEWIAAPMSADGIAARHALLAHWYAARALGLAEFATRAVRPFDRTAAGAFSPANRAELDALFAHLTSFRVLAVTRETPRTGADAVNAELHRHHAETTGRRAREPLLPGEPVLMTHNDYDRGLWNGDDGLIVNVRDPGRRDAEPMAVFRRAGEFVAFSLDSIRNELQLAWVTTVHKAQGSEFDHVCVVLPEENIPLLTCEVLYAAVSRSRCSVVLAGDETVLANGVRARIERFSGTAEKVEAPPFLPA